MQDHHSTYSCLILYSTSLPILVALIAAAYCFMFENSPPEFPLPYNINCVDCSSIRINTISNELNRLKVELQIDDFSEYPKSAASSMVHVIVQTGGTVIDYGNTQFIDTMNNGTHLSFSILQQFNGFAHAGVYCQNQLLGSYSYTVDDIIFNHAGFSKSKAQYETVSHFENVCFKNILKNAKKFQKDEKNEETINQNKDENDGEDIDKSNESLIFFSNVDKMKIGQLKVTKKKKISLINDKRNIFKFNKDENLGNIEIKPTLMISATPKKLENQLYEVLLPIWKTIQQTGNPGLYKFAFPNSKKVKNSKKIQNLAFNIQKIIPNERIDLKKGKCFKKIEFLKTTGSVPYLFNSTNTDDIQAKTSHFQWIQAFPPKIFPIFKSLYTNITEFKNRTIVITRSLKPIKKIIEQILPEEENITILTFPKTKDLSIAASTIASAHIFIADTIESLLFGIFLSENSTLIEIPPIGMECTEFGKVFAEFGKAKYMSFFKGSENCTCRSLECYFHENQNQISIDSDRLAHYLNYIFSMNHMTLTNENKGKGINI